MNEWYQETPAGAAQVLASLEGAEYPATRDELIIVAERNNARHDVLETLQQLPPGMVYDSPADLLDEVWGHN